MRKLIFLAVILAACAGTSEPTMYEHVREDFPGAADWYEDQDIDEQAALACDLVRETGGEGPEWQAQIAGLWAGTPHVRQEEVFGDDPGQIVTYFRILASHSCPELLE